MDNIPSEPLSLESEIKRARLKKLASLTLLGLLSMIGVFNAIAAILLTFSGQQDRIDWSMVGFIVVCIVASAALYSSDKLKHLRLLATKYDTQE